MLLAKSAYFGFRLNNKYGMKSEADRPEPWICDASTKQQQQNVFVKCSTVTARVSAAHHLPKRVRAMSDNQPYNWNEPD